MLDESIAACVCFFARERVLKQGERVQKMQVGCVCTCVMFDQVLKTGKTLQSVNRPLRRTRRCGVSRQCLCEAVRMMACKEQRLVSIQSLCRIDTHI